MFLEQSLTKDILDSIGEGLCTVDKNFRISFFNRAAEDITGYRREETIDKFCKHVFKSDHCFHRCPIALVLETGRNIHNFESQIRHRNGNVLNIKLNASLLRNGDDEPLGGIFSFKDLSDLEAINDNLLKRSHFYGIIGQSKTMQGIFQLVEEISDSDAAVLIQGESGTGKEMVANAIQASSARNGKPFVKINCSVFPEHLLASELFGHVRGAFTGAVKDRLG